MFLPLQDDNPHKVIRVQWVTLGIIAINIIVFLMTAWAGDAQMVKTANTFGVVPALFGHQDPATVRFFDFPLPLTLITYQFVHAGWGHIFFNMLFLWIFADNVEDAYGHVAFALFYGLTGIVSGLAHIFMAPGSVMPLVGASGAVSGVMAAYLLLFPRAKVWILFSFVIPLRIPAGIILVGWFGLQVFGAFYVPHGKVEISWWTHIIGFLFGLALTFLLRGRLADQET